VEDSSRAEHRHSDVEYVKAGYDHHGREHHITSREDAEHNNG
jgi:hypothetical protein